MKLDSCRSCWSGTHKIQSIKPNAIAMIELAVDGREIATSLWIIQSLSHNYMEDGSPQQANGPNGYSQCTILPSSPPAAAVSSCDDFSAGDVQLI